MKNFESAYGEILNCFERNSELKVSENFTKFVKFNSTNLYGYF